MEQKKQPSHIIAVAQLKLVLVLILILILILTPRLVFTHSCKKCDVGNGHISQPSDMQDPRLRALSREATFGISVSI